MIKDKLVTWFLQNMIIPHHEIIDKPGFILSNITTEEGKKTYIRDMLLPEFFFENIETEIVKKYGQKGKDVLYTVGNKYGYLYASMQSFPVIAKTNEKTILSFAYIFARYLEGTDASEVKYDVNLKERIFRVWLKDYIICKNDGIGLMMTDGATGGIWAWVCGDNSIEGIQKSCQGNGAESCEVVCGPVKSLDGLSEMVHKETNLLSYAIDEEYESKNKIRTTRYAKNSLKMLLDNKLFDYKSGIFSYKGKRFLMNESHILFLIEDSIGNLPEGVDILFECSFKTGEELAKTYGGNDWNKFITDFFPALGFGDIAVLDQKTPRIGISYYPWSKLFQNSKYVIIIGILSGVISECINKEVILALEQVKVGEYVDIVLKAQG